MADEQRTPFNYSGKLAYLQSACCDPRLQRTDLAVLSVLVNHANQATGKAFCSVDTIVKASGVPKTTVLRALRRLDEADQVKTEKRFGASSTYWLTGSTAGTGVAPGTGSVDGTGANWNRTGAIQGLRVGRTGSVDGTGPVPAVEPEQKKKLLTEREQGPADAGSSPAEPVDSSHAHRPACPHQAIVALYHEVLPELRQVRIWNDSRKRLLARRWAESSERQDLEWWRGYFGYVRRSPWLMGKSAGRDGRPFDCDLEWLICPTNFPKVIEGKYEKPAA